MLELVVISSVEILINNYQCINICSHFLEVKFTNELPSEPSLEHLLNFITFYKK